MAFTAWSLADWLEFLVVGAIFFGVLRWAETKQKSGEMPRPSRKTVILTGCIPLGLLTLITVEGYPDLNTTDILLNVAWLAGLTAWFIRQVARYPERS